MTKKYFKISDYTKEELQEILYDQLYNYDYTLNDENVTEMVYRDISQCEKTVDDLLLPYETNFWKNLK